jgi:signal transduction histidine kinase
LSSYFVPTLIDDVINEPDINGKIQLQGDVPEQVVNIDVGRIKFLLRNLLKNAIDHSPENTEIFFSISQGNEQLKFAVQDHGSGIPKAALEHIFDPFYCVENTSHRDTRGTGLGLYLSQRIAKAHKGQLQVTSEQGKGSVFTLILPIEKA